MKRDCFVCNRKISKEKVSKEVQEQLHKDCIELINRSRNSYEYGFRDGITFIFNRFLKESERE